MEIDIKKYKHIYMSGIGGISMSGIAEILKSWGYDVSGSDSNKSNQTDWLESKGIRVNIGQVAENITNIYDLFVYSAAIKSDNPEMVKAKELGIPTIERGEFLGEITKLFKDTIGIAGTHGKTSTTSMVAGAFLEANLDPSIQVGAVLRILDGNYRVGNSDYFIIEACEYCDSFLNFHQRSAIVLNIDNDHLDYFKNIDNICKSFQKYVSLLPGDGYLVLNRDDEKCYELRNYTKAKVISVGSNDNADWYYKDVVFNEEGFATYDAYKNGENKGSISLKVAGLHNVFNSLCCIALCDAYDIDIDIVASSLLKFTGAARRLEFKGMINGAKIFDDYGHHPTEITATINGIKNKKYNESWVVFEAHTYSRLAGHLNEFADSLKDFDHIVITDIYAARETNTYNIHEEDLINELKKYNKEAIHISDYDEIVKYLKNNVKENDIVLTLGAGNVTKIASKLVEDSN
ncbi:MAG TPA: UDP-N-acetylmuramate--L-alanine ligase [Firmicutes bacterium]|nr:UDP-N-acetylmuramate--L-alanine ligase [Bacillota bacterium]